MGRSMERMLWIWTLRSNILMEYVSLTTVPPSWYVLTSNDRDGVAQLRIQFVVNYTDGKIVKIDIFLSPFLYINPHVFTEVVDKALVALEQGEVIAEQLHIQLLF